MSALTITLTPESAALIKAAQQWPRALIAALVKELNLQNEYSVSHIQEARLSQRGPETLGVRTNRLRASIRRTAAAVETSGSIIGSIGSNVRYAGAHEFGFTGTVPVRAHTRRKFSLFTVEGKTTSEAFFDSRTGKIGRRKTKFFKAPTGIIQVKAHEISLKIPARAPIRRGIEDRLPEYNSALSLAVVQALTPGPAPA